MPRALSTSFNNADLLEKLSRAGSLYLLVGGAAVAFYGGRDDEHLAEVDILIDPSIENSERVMNVLSAAGVQLWIQPGDLAGPKKQLPVKQLLFDMDILTPGADESFSVLLSRSVKGTVCNIEVEVIGRDDLIAMKTAAANDPKSDVQKHKRDLDRLNA